MVRLVVVVDTFEGTMTFCTLLEVSVSDMESSPFFLLRRLEARESPLPVEEDDEVVVEEWTAVSGPVCG